MAINRTSLAAQPITEEVENVVIEMRNDQPNTAIILDPPEVPGKLVGYYNGSKGWVELYVVNSAGTRLLPF